MLKGTPLGGRNKGIYKVKTDAGIHYRISFTAQSNGKRRYITRKCSSLTEARRRLAELRAKHQLGDLPSAPAEKMKLAELAAIMIAMKKHNRSWDDTKRYVKEIVTFFGADTAVEAIDERRISEYLDHLCSQPKRGHIPGLLSNQSKDHRLIELRHMLSVAKKKGVIANVPSIRFFRNYGKRVYNITRADFYRLVELMPEPPKPHRSLLWMCFFTGQRRSDLLNMRWDQLHAMDGSFRFIRYRSSKNSRDLSIPVPPILREALEQLVPYRDPKNPWLFPNPNTGKPYVDIRKFLLRASERLDLKPAVTLHMIRHMAADGILEATGDPSLVQRYMGWSSAQMVEVYTHAYSRAGKAAETYGEIVARELAHIPDVGPVLDQVILAHQAENKQPLGDNGLSGTPGGI